MTLFKLIHLYIISLLFFFYKTDFVWSRPNASPDLEDTEKMWYFMSDSHPKGPNE